MTAPDTTTALVRHARGFSRALGWMLESDPALAAVLEQFSHVPVDVRTQWRALTQAAEQTADGAMQFPWGVALRRLRRRIWALTALRDLNDLSSLAEVTSSMSDLAEVAIACATDHLQQQLSERFGVPDDGCGLVVVSMGKLGGRELNVSSDIDLIFLYPHEGQTIGPRSLEHQEYFNRLAPLVIRALSDVTEEGPLFRVDMRLRPHGDSGPMVCSFDMLEEYFISQGRAWERCAWIKARPMETSDASQRPSVAEELQNVVRPFVYRKYLDFSAIESLRQLHRLIRQQAREADDHVKLGAGGIREIEFIAQGLQLIRGGKDPQLQNRETLVVLGRLGGQQILLPEVAAGLQEAYAFLRRLEHRLQYADDAQTHTLPAAGEAREKVAASLGFASLTAFDKHHREVREFVQRHFEAIFSEPEQVHQPDEMLWSNGLESNDAKATLAGLGYAQPEDSARRLQALQQGRRYRQLSTESQRRFNILVPQVIHGAAATAHPDLALGRALSLLEHICHRATYLALLHEYPQALRRVLEICAASGWATDYLQRHPLLLDELLDARSLQGEPDWQEFAAALEMAMVDASDDVEVQMNKMRELRHAQEFRLLLRDLAGQMSVERLADHLSLLADIILASTLKWAAHHLRLTQPRFAIIGYGKLGGKELGYQSDLDLIFVFEDEMADAVERYGRLARRVNTWLSSSTLSGVLYATDLRLRPDGDAGLWAQSLEGLDKYLRQSAWVWELQAVTRARYCAGDAAVGRSFESLRREILCQPREIEPLRQEVRAMRHKVTASHPASDRFDVKYSRGGLIDVEFIVQFLILAHAHHHPELTENLGNIALLRKAADFGLIPVSLATDVGGHYRLLRHLQHGLRLNEDATELPPDRVPCVNTVLQLWSAVFAEEPS